MVGYWGARACNALSLYTGVAGNVGVSWNTKKFISDPQKNFANSKECQLY